jgi:hypothetical protein
LFVASYDEGFGLPLVEAAMHSRPVLARDLPVFREQRLPNVKLFSNDCPAGLATRLMDLTTAGLGKAPKPQLPTWAGCVDDLLLQIGFSAKVEGQMSSPLRNAS